MVCSLFGAKSYCLDKCQFLVISTIWSIFQWNLNEITANVIGSKMSSVKLLPGCLGPDMLKNLESKFLLFFIFTEMYFYRFSWPYSLTGSDNSLAADIPKPMMSSLPTWGQSVAYAVATSISNPVETSKVVVISYARMHTGSQGNVTSGIQRRKPLKS